MSDPLSEFPEFSESIRKRLEAGRAEYGDASFGKHPTELLKELQEEALDLAGWGYVLWKRLRSMEDSLE